MKKHLYIYFIVNITFMVLFIGLFKNVINYIFISIFSILLINRLFYGQNS